jgi:predicted phosphodiesterase
MVRYLILSDIHANREALEAVLDHAHGEFDQILCLGDLVGYGPDPNFVVDWARMNVAAIVRGNHDRIVTDDSSLDSFSDEARDGVTWTKRTLSAENHTYLQTMPRGPISFSGLGLVHGSPVNEDQYLRHPKDVAAVAPHLEAEITFFGHTHVPGAFHIQPTEVRPLDPAVPLEIKPGDGRYMVNPGSVGQPRDGNWRAAYVLYAPEDRTVQFYRVPYNVGPTAEKIVLANMPAINAARLLMGK